MKHTKKAKRIATLLLVLIMGTALVACDNADENKTSSTKEDTSAADSGIDAKQGDDASSDDSFDFASIKFDYYDTFSEGYAWVKEKGSSVYFLIDQSGKKCSEYDYGSEISSIEDILDFAPSSVQDGASFVSNGKSHSGGMIVDTEGNVLYRLSDTENNSEQCMAYGDGYYLLCRTVKSFDENSQTCVVIDKNGKELFEPVSIDTNEYPEAQYFSDGIFRVDYTFIDTNAAEPIISKPESEIYSTSNDFDKLESKDGKIWLQIYQTSDERGIGLFDLHTLECQRFIQTDNILVNYGTYVVADNVYYDLDGYSFDVGLYGDKAYDFSPVSDDGLIAVSLFGEDNGYYFAYIDTQGNEIKTPTKRYADGAYDADHYCIYEEGILTVYDPDGSEVFRTNCNAAPGDEGTLILGEDYVICSGYYYFF